MSMGPPRRTGDRRFAGDFAGAIAERETEDVVHHVDAGLPRIRVGADGNRGQQEKQGNEPNHARRLSPEPGSGNR
jgi:hypothetical protein